MRAETALRLLGFALLLGANAFFVASECVLLTVSPTLLQHLQGSVELGQRRTVRALARLYGQVDLWLSAVQLGVTLCALGLGWAAGPSVGLQLRQWLPAPAPPSLRAWLDAALTGAGFLLVGGLDIVLAEIVPKRVALQHADRMALALALPMEAFLNLTRPLLRLIGGSADLTLRLLGLGGAAVPRAYSAEELKLLAGASLHRGHLEPVQEEIIRRVLDLHRVPVREIMTARPQVAALPVESTLAQAWEFMAAHARSRVPVYEGDLDHLAGLLNAKDLLRALYGQRQGKQPPPLRGLLRRLPVVPESKPVEQLLRQFQRGAPMAAVVDEFGTFIGLVTLEDALEQIVGEVSDEFDPLPEAAAAGVIELGGLTPIRDVEMLLAQRLPRDDDYATLAGFLLARLRRLPGGGERVECCGRRFTVTAVEGRRIARVRIEPLPEAAGPQAGGEETRSHEVA